jgi:hypothetical protein
MNWNLIGDLFIPNSYGRMGLRRSDEYIHCNTMYKHVYTMKNTIDPVYIQ